MISILFGLHFTVGTIVAILYGLVAILPNISLMQQDQEYRHNKLYIALICFFAWEYLIVRGLRKQ